MSFSTGNSIQVSNGHLLLLEELMPCSLRNVRQSVAVTTDPKRDPYSKRHINVGETQTFLKRGGKARID